MRTFAIGDIHGGYKALLQCFERAKFDYTNDLLIVLGDVCDGWPETKKCVDELLKIKNLIPILGNHDYWMLRWFLIGASPEIWTSQGGWSTIDSYLNKNNCREIPLGHIHLFQSVAKPYYIDDKNRIFVHGGFDRKKPIQGQSVEFLMWDRELIQTAWNTSKQGGSKPKKMTEFEEVFVGHTPVSILGGLDKPLNFFEIWDLDTGGGWEGKLTIMDVDTKEYWQSDLVYTLYPGEHGRQGKKLYQQTRFGSMG